MSNTTEQPRIIVATYEDLERAGLRRTEEKPKVKESCAAPIAGIPKAHRCTSCDGGGRKYYKSSGRWESCRSCMGSGQKYQYRTR